MEVKQPFEKDYLTDEEMISVATMNGKIPLEKVTMRVEVLKEYQKEYGSVKGKTYENISETIGPFF